MRVLICIDDTDNLESKGTGAIADELRELIRERQYGTCGFITRHQLLIHEDIPYTSHNSSMCFDAQISGTYYEEMTHALTDYVRTESATGSDPGIAIVGWNETDGFDRRSEKMLYEFGLCAKRSVLQKAQAYELAEKTEVYLQEMGGTGQGVIGALAGIGLRLSGNDGELKGGISSLEKGSSYLVGSILDETEVESVCYETAEGRLQTLPREEKIKVVWKAKPVLSYGKILLLVIKGEDGGWAAVDKKELRRFGNDRVLREGCNDFSPDVEEEWISEEQSCYNCRYRRWAEENIICQKSGIEARFDGSKADA